MIKSERGGFAIGLVVGLLIGLALALGVALYVTKVPVPFVNKVPQRTAEQDAAEIERNKTWDPNAPLAGKPAAKAAMPVPATAASAPPAVVTGKPPGTTPAAAPPRGPAAILAGGGASPAPAAATPPPRSAKPGADPFTYFVQAGAFQRVEDAEAQRAKVGMLGIETKIIEREQGGRTVYRVRVGPFDKQIEADGAKDRLADAGLDAVLVRVERPAQ